MSGWIVHYLLTEEAHFVIRPGVAGAQVPPPPPPRRRPDRTTLRPPHPVFLEGNSSTTGHVVGLWGGWGPPRVGVSPRVKIQKTKPA